MKKTVLVLVYLIGLSNLVRANVSIELDAGILTQKGATAGTTGAALTGGLLEFIVSPSGSAANFSAPTATSFVSGDNVVVFSATINSNGGVTGETVNPASFALTTSSSGTASTTTIDTGDPILVRFYPSLTTSSTAPGAGTAFGQFRSDTGEQGGTAFVVPPDGNSVDINYITLSDGGAESNLSASAQFTVVPEPSSCVGGLLCCAAVAFAKTRSGRYRAKLPLFLSQGSR